MTAAIVAHRGPDILRDAGESGAQLRQTLAVQFGMLVEGGVQIGDICLMMLSVMDLHRQRVDVRLERGEIVRQFG